MNKFTLLLTVIVLVIAGVIGWSYINKPTTIPLTKINIPAQTGITPTTVITLMPTITGPIAETSTLTYVNPSPAIDSFETAIPTKKYSDMAEYMTPTVTITKYATSCCGLLSKAQAISELSYLSGAVGPWDFSMTNPILKKLESADPETFKDIYVGTSSNNYAVGIELNDNYLITKIILIGDYHLITGQ